MANKFNDTDINGSLVVGVTGTTRGVVSVTRGAGGDKPGAVLFEALDGTPWYFWVAADGDLRFHSSLPTADTDGQSVHSNDAASMGFLDDTTPVSITNPGIGAWEEFNGMEAGHSVQFGTKAVVAVGANDTITLSATGSGTYGFHLTGTADVATVSDNIAMGISVNNAAPADNARSGQLNVTAGDPGSLSQSGMIVLSDNDMLKVEFVNITNATRNIRVSACTLFVWHIG